MPTMAIGSNEGLSSALSTMKGILCVVVSMSLLYYTCELRAEGLHVWNNDRR